MTNDRIRANPPEPSDEFIVQVLAGSGTYGTINLSPMLMLNRIEEESQQNGNGSKNGRQYGDKSLQLDEVDDAKTRAAIASFQMQTSTQFELLPVKTVPSHFSQVFEADERDFRAVFGWEDDPQSCNFAIGEPLDMSVPVCIDLKRFVERSNGVFGKSGTGKSFLTRLLLAGTIRKRAAVNLIFDMHSEYGWEAVQEGGGKNDRRVKGLRQLFPHDVVVYTLDPDSTKRRGMGDARTLKIGYNQLEIKDLQLAARELDLSEIALDNAYILYQEYNEHWISRLLEMTNEDITVFCEAGKGHKGSIGALQRKLLRLDKLKYMEPYIRTNYVEEMLKEIDSGKSVVIEFGNQSDLLSYMLVTNTISRRIHERYVEKAEHYLHTKNERDRPKQLIITIEEAHRFLDPSIAKSTIFGTIARELRKYFVTLLIVDQRPSGIDREIMSQIGTRITALLNDEKDIEAIFTGMPGGQSLRSVLAKLDSKQQALVLGHAVPMPVVVKTRPYDAKFYADLGCDDWEEKSDEEVIAAAASSQMDLGF
jgi:uncharacterized protein